MCLTGLSWSISKPSIHVTKTSHLTRQLLQYIETAGSSPINQGHLEEITTRAGGIPIVCITLQHTCSLLGLLMGIQDCIELDGIQGCPYSHVLLCSWFCQMPGKFLISKFTCCCNWSLSVSLHAGWVAHCNFELWIHESNVCSIAKFK